MVFGEYDGLSDALLGHVRVIHAELTVAVSR